MKNGRLGNPEHKRFKQNGKHSKRNSYNIFLQTTLQKALGLFQGFQTPVWFSFVKSSSIFRYFGQVRTIFFDRWQCGFSFYADDTHSHSLQLRGDVLTGAWRLESRPLPRASLRAHPSRAVWECTTSWLSRRTFTSDEWAGRSRRNGTADILGEIPARPLNICGTLARICLDEVWKFWMFFEGGGRCFLRHLNWLDAWWCNFCKRSRGFQATFQKFLTIWRKLCFDQRVTSDSRLHSTSE